MFENAFSGKSWDDCATELGISRRALFKRRQSPKITSVFNEATSRMLNGEWPRICGNMAAIASGDSTFTTLDPHTGKPTVIDKAKPSEQISAAEWVRKVLGMGVEKKQVEVECGNIIVEVTDSRLLPKRDGDGAAT